MTPCPHCGAPLNLAGLPPGSWLPCTCGQQVQVPGAPTASTAGPVPVAGAPRRRRFNPWVWVPIALLLGACPCVGVLAAIAVPNFIKFQAKSKQAEAKTHLKAWYTGVKAAQAERPPEEWSELVRLGAVGFATPTGNRYACWSSLEGETAEPGQDVADATGFTADTRRFPDAVVEPDALGELVTPGQDGECPECGFTFACAGNLDNDATWDVWSIGTVDRTTTDGKTIPAGEPFHQLDDVVE